MYGKSNQIRVLFAVMALVCLSAGIATAAIVTNSITYQGKLTNAAGSPLTGTYSVTFRIYDASTGGTALSTDTHSVTATNGLFTTSITVTDPAVVDGRALWLGIKVGADAEMTPRQEIRPVPYSLSVRPGAWITSTDGYPALNLQNGALNVSTSSYKSAGVITSTSGRESPGIVASTYGDGSTGVTASTYGDGGTGVLASTNGDRGIGVTASTNGDGSTGIYVNSGGRGSYAVDARTSSADNCVGVSAWTLGQSSDGVQSQTAGAYSRGVSIETIGQYSDGVYAHTFNDNSRGVYAHTSGTGSNGVFAQTFGTNSDGVYAYADGIGSHGVYAYSAGDDAIYASSGSSSHYGLYTPNYIYAHGSKYPSVDVAEYFPVKDAVPGTVMIIGPTGTLQPSLNAYDTRVAGIISTDPAVSLGAKDAGNPGEAPLAVAGRVPCKVDAGSGAIHPGDLLCTSDTPGHAMKAEPVDIGGRKFYPDGTILGKALGSLERGTGTIEVLVTLQ